MDPLGKKELLSFYDRHLKDYGDSPHALRWTPEGQLRRYETLLQIGGNLSGKSVLDFGCGKGDFHGFIEENGMRADYCGIDINENLIQLARKKYPFAEFISADIEDSPISRTFDVVFDCGVFNLRIAGIEQSMKESLKMLFGMCREALHVCLLTHYVPRRSVELFYVKPEEILGFALAELSRTVTLRHEEEDVYLSVYKS